MPNTITWEKRKLEEFSKTTIGEFVIKTKQNPNSKYPVYNGGVSYTGFYDDFNNNGHKIIVSARGANAGFINIINGKYWAGNSCYSIDIQDNYCIEYVYHFMKHKQHLFTDFQQAANIPSVSKKDVEEFLISYPKSKEEQTQIGNFFKQLDDTIALHQRELEKFKILKTSYLENIFLDKVSLFTAKNTITWEQRKLGTCGNIITGNTPSTKNKLNYTDNGLLWVTPTDIKSNITTKTANTLSEEGKKLARTLPKNSILVTCIASIGKNTLILEEASCNQQINALVPNNNHDPYFLLTYSFIWSEKMKLIAGAGTMDIVNKTQFSDILCAFPSLEEQTQIGNFFKQLDDTIALHQKELAKYQQIKTACLEKMFVE